MDVCPCGISAEIYAPKLRHDKEFDGIFQGFYKNDYIYNKKFGFLFH